MKKEKEDYTFHTSSAGMKQLEDAMKNYLAQQSFQMIIGSSGYHVNPSINPLDKVTICLSDPLSYDYKEGRSDMSIVDKIPPHLSNYTITTTPYIGDPIKVMTNYTSYAYDPYNKNENS